VSAAVIGWAEQEGKAVPASGRRQRAYKVETRVMYSPLMSVLPASHFSKRVPNARPAVKVTGDILISWEGASRFNGRQVAEEGRGVEPSGEIWDQLAVVGSSLGLSEGATGFKS
jgi:hypothetical protein